MPVDLLSLEEDLTAEQAALEVELVALEAPAWSIPTPSPTWTVLEQVAHLAVFDADAALAITDPSGFDRRRRALLEAATKRGLDAASIGDLRTEEPATVLAAWQQGAAALRSATGQLSPDDRLAWYGPSMSAASFVTARLMECFAHGADIRDALGAPIPATTRLAPICRLGVMTRGWSYAVRGATPPPGALRVELRAPGGETWRFGDSDGELVAGPALDFCLVVTQRRNLLDTELEVGPLGADWLRQAQCFAGGPTLGPASSLRR